MLFILSICNERKKKHIFTLYQRYYVCVKDNVFVMLNIHIIFGLSVGVGAFVIGLSQISSFFSVHIMIHFSLNQPCVFHILMFKAIYVTKLKP